VVRVFRCLYCLEVCCYCVVVLFCLVLSCLVVSSLLLSYRIVSSLVWSGLVVCDFGLGCVIGLQRLCNCDLSCPYLLSSIPILFPSPHKSGETRLRQDKTKQGNTDADQDQEKDEDTDKMREE
jgi:hypothetical protein